MFLSLLHLYLHVHLYVTAETVTSETVMAETVMAEPKKAETVTETTTFPAC